MRSRSNLLSFLSALSFFDMDSFFLTVLSPKIMTYILEGLILQFGSKMKFFWRVNFSGKSWGIELSCCGFWRLGCPLELSY